MLRLLSLLSLLAVATAPCALRAQESDDGVPVLGPRFLLATRAARRVPVDVARSPVLSQRISLDLEGVTLVDTYQTFVGHEAQYVSIDGLHLTPAGYQAIADAFFAAIKSTIPQTAPASINAR